MSAAGRSRRALAWIHLGIQVAVLLALLVVVNLIARRHPSRIDLTSRREYALSNLAEDMLRNLECDVEVWVNSELYGTDDDKSLPQALMRTGSLLEEFSRRTRKFRFHMIAPGNIPRQEVLQKHWTLLSPATIYILTDAGAGKTNKKSVELQQLYDGNPQTGELLSYRGEPLLVQAIRELSGGEKRILYETEGHQEIPTEDTRQMGVLRNFLTLNEGVEIRKLPMATYKSVPVDCDILMVMAPAQPFLKHEVDLFRGYLERGGSMLVALRPRVKTGLDELLLEYGVKVGEGVVHDSQQFVPPRTTDLLVRQFSAHDINRSMVNVQVRMPDSAPVDPVELKNPDFKIVPLAMAGPSSWEEKDEPKPGKRAEPGPGERVGGLKLIVAVEKPASKPQDRKHGKTKLIVWGSPAPFTNAVLLPSGLLQQVELNYVVNHFRWLNDRTLIETDVNKIAVKPLEMSDAALSRLRIGVVGGLPAFVILLGLVVWFLRRK